MRRKLLTAMKISDALIAAALAVLVIWLGFAKYYLSHNSVLIAVSLVLGGIVCCIFCDIWHELGHVLFGYLCKFSFNSLHIGFLKIYKQKSSLRIGVRQSGGSVAGAVEMLPKNSENLYSRFLRTVAGGLIFSFIVLAAFTLCTVMFRRLPFAAYIFICTGLPYAFHLFYYNLIPQDNDSLSTDGALLWGLIRKDASYMTAVNILAIEGYMNVGYTPAEIEKDLYFGLPQLPEDDINFILLTCYRLMYYIDGGDAESAVNACNRLESVMEYVPDIYCKDIASEIMFCECSMKGGAEIARDMFPALEKHLLREDSLTSHRILAAYEIYVNGNKCSALSHINEAQKKAETADIAGLIKYEKKLLENIRNDIANIE